MPAICIDMSEMDKVLQINEEDGDLICQAGARWEDINRLLKEKGIPLFFPVGFGFFIVGRVLLTLKELDPGPGATIGGMIGTGCSGSASLLYSHRTSTDVSPT